MRLFVRQSLELFQGRDSPSPSDYGGPVTLAVQEGVYNRKDRKRGRRESTRGASGDEEEAAASTRTTRPSKRVRTDG